MVHGQPIEFIIDSGSPVTIIPPIINPTDIKKTTKKIRGCKQKPNKIPKRISQQILHRSVRNLVDAASGHLKRWFNGPVKTRHLSWDSDWVRTLS